MRAFIYSGLVIAQDGDHMDWNSGWWVVMMIGMVLFWALVAFGIVWLVHSLQGGAGSRRHGEPDALELLDRRLAEGAISVEEYEQRRRVLVDSSRDRGDS